MKFDQGCYCKNGSVTTNSKECNGQNCTTCLPGSYLITNVCSNCSKGRAECTDKNSCQKCAAGSTMHNKDCVKTCGCNKNYDDEVSKYCDISQNKYENVLIIVQFAPQRRSATATRSQLYYNNLWNLHWNLQECE
ncbi:Cysteine-rich protein [Spironucleus salmonicida]|uniref:Cysteine-rich protein n=1 Tax=Spironucleus salmonicida TaxID=348837 RepID=A0A9P8LKK7_9EUKA|nr:Cysteine-rich protein [Spironucleus salmonicida]